MENIVALIAMVAFIAFLAWLGVRASRTKSALAKWSGMVLTAVLAVSVFGVAALTAVGIVRQHARSAPVPDVKIEATPDQIARGMAVADGFCAACHSQTGTLTGGGDVAKDLPIPIGSFVPANLTPAGVLKNWSDAEIFRAIRNGIDARGRWLAIMSFTNAGRLSDDDTKAVIAYIRSLPASGTQTPDPPDRFSLLGIVMLGAGLLPDAKPVFTGVITAPPKAPTALYGKYLLSYQDCRECHGRDLGGGVPGQLPPLGPDLGIVKNWSLAQFVDTMRTGVDPNGHRLGEQMPWRPIGRMDDDDLAAIYQYLLALPGS
ncbi:c-type cytochrome [Bradyrhizobium sp. 61]|uniref:c-type cytochrome n=1 Tax=unclassified Bradyrhizobium TaxID=2631580 RepID=UPI001FFA88B6|nr:MULTISPECIES: c-type cytochrome [unclassified Bradyrhizobium]MCK1274102.1 c-type cytochrome [Bradyrhizobium sp. 61]MCK1447474.1 c-type cytochrome [Bradyrhizobium sp. 48]MCK1462809.1 c-type cytochrome [Bradyrhizobium sp. 2]